MGIYQQRYEMNSDVKNKKDFEKYNRILIFAEKRDISEPCFSFLEQQGEIYLAKNIQDGILHLTLFIYHLVCVSIKNHDYAKMSYQLVDTIRKVSESPILVVVPEMPELKYKLIHAGAEAVLKIGCSTEEFSLHVYALIRAYKRWKSEKKEVIDVTVEKLTINALQRKVYWGEKEILVVKREFDFLYLLATTPGRVYTYSQIYHMIWQEYPQGDLKNIIYCMVHRLKQKMQQVDIKAANMICTVKEVGYCLKVHNVL